MNPNVFASACWIGPNEPSTSAVVVRRFNAHADELATLYITGLGYFEARLNGKRLGRDCLQPNPTDYEPRRFARITYPCHDRFTHRIYYKRFTCMLCEGENLLEIQLGGGWFVQNERIAEGTMGFGDRVKCIYALQTPGCDLHSDGSEQWFPGDIVYSNLFVGEIIDPSVEKQCYPVIALSPPDSQLCPELGVPDRQIRLIKPRKLGVSEGRTIFDVGENISGYVRVRSKPGFAGRVTLRFAEEVSDGKLDFSSTGADYRCASGLPQVMTDVFICDGSERIYEPKFVWHCFRYFDIEGEVAAADAVVVHSDVAVTSGFESDSEGCNFLYDAYIRTQLDNMHGSFPSDCPHRERLGYTGDGQITAETAMMLLNSREFYRKWIYDILDCQDQDSGHIQHTAPFMGGGGGPGGWGAAIVVVPYYFWKQFGETDILRESYPAMLKWMDYLKAHSEQSLVVREEEGGWCLGDWCTLEACRLPEPLVNSYYFIKSIGMLREIASAIGADFENTGLEALAQNSLCSIRQRYFTGDYDKTQGRLAYGAALGLVSADACAAYYDELGHFDTGFLATEILSELLCESGHVDTLYKLLENRGPGGYLYMKHRGATTIWERWTGGSHCHPMFGAAAKQLFKGILGIKQLSDSAGWARLEISPRLPAGMNWAKGFIQTVRGKIEVELWRDCSGCVHSSVKIAEKDEIFDGGD